MPDIVLNLKWVIYVLSIVSRTVFVQTTLIYNLWTHSLTGRLGGDQTEAPGPAGYPPDQVHFHMSNDDIHFVFFVLILYLCSFSTPFFDRTSAKIGLYSSRHQPADDEADNDDRPTDEQPGDETTTVKDERPEVDPHVKSLIQSVAFEIQKSFSQRNLRKVRYSNFTINRTEKTKLCINPSGIFSKSLRQ